MASSTLWCKAFAQWVASSGEEAIALTALTNAFSDATMVCGVGDSADDEEEDDGRHGQTPATALTEVVGKTQWRDRVDASAALSDSSELPQCDQHQSSSGNAEAVAAKDDENDDEDGGESVAAHHSDGNEWIP